MATTLLIFPKCHLLAVILTTPQAAALVAEAMRETSGMRKPWYGFQITRGTKPTVSGCRVVARVNSPEGDKEGLEVNRRNIGLRGYHVFEPNSIRGTLRVRVIPFPESGGLL